MTLGRALVAFTVVMSLWMPGLAWGQISKGHRILIERGLQIQGMVTRDDVFHLSTYGFSLVALGWERKQHAAPER
jgi:hypothetical protein